jgi:hypothetical protein
MIRYRGPRIGLTTALHRGLFLAVIMDRYKGPLIALTLALHRAST